MATRGVFQLRRLQVHYCEHGGSSRTLRDYIASGRLARWAAEHPHVEILVTPRNGNHPFIQGDYRSCATVRHQVSVKNYRSLRDVEDVLDMLHSRSGRKIKKITTPVLTDTPSIQGVWTPFLRLTEEQPRITVHRAGEEL